MFRRQQITKWDIIDRALSILQTGGWQSGSWGSHLAVGPHCVEGAIDAAVNDLSGQTVKRWEWAALGWDTIRRRRLNALRLQARAAVETVLEAEGFLDRKWGGNIPVWNDEVYQHGDHGFAEVRRVLNTAKERVKV